MKKLWSIFTDDMDHCMFTGSSNVERHHVFYYSGGGYKEKCEKYGFIAPLSPHMHPNGTQRGQAAGMVDLVLKQKCQEYYESNYGTRDDFRREFGKSYL